MLAIASITGSVDHLGVVAGTVVLNAAVCAGARRDPAAPWIRWFARGLGGLLVVALVAPHVSMIAHDRWGVAWALPCHLCDAAIAASIVALFRPGPLAFELTYFWGLGGALQGLVTPAIDVGFPELAWVHFFFVHVALVTSAILLAFGLGMRPRPRVVLRMMIWTNVWALLAGITNWLTGGNYMFLREPPTTGSLLDLLGEWPWYILAGEVVALAVFSALALPFRVRKLSPR